MGQDLLSLPVKTAQLSCGNLTKIISLITDLAESCSKLCNDQNQEFPYMQNQEFSIKISKTITT